MLGNKIVENLNSHPSVNLPNLKLFLNFIKTKIKSHHHKSSTSISTPGTRLLTEIINLSNVRSYLLSNPNNKNFEKDLLSRLSDIETVIDTRHFRKALPNQFVLSKSGGSASCYEIIVPARRQNPLVSIPIGKDYNDPAWSNINPFRVYDMGDFDLSFNVYKSRLDFYGKSPSYAIYTVDCFALIAKFIAYYKSSKWKIVDYENILQEFLHEEIVTKTLIGDILPIYLRNVFMQQFAISTDIKSSETADTDTTDLDTLGSEFSAAMFDIRKLKQFTANNNLHPLTVLSSILITPDNEDFISYYKNLYFTTQLPDDRTYFWVECVKNLRWWRFILTVFSLNPDHPYVISFYRDVLREVRIWMYIRPWNNIPSGYPYKGYVKKSIENLYEELNAV